MQVFLYCLLLFIFLNNNLSFFIGTLLYEHETINLWNCILITKKLHLTVCLEEQWCLFPHSAFSVYYFALICIEYQIFKSYCSEHSHNKPTASDPILWFQNNVQTLYIFNLNKKQEVFKFNFFCSFLSHLYTVRRHYFIIIRSLFHLWSFLFQYQLGVCSLWKYLGKDGTL